MKSASDSYRPMIVNYDGDFDTLTILAQVSDFFEELNRSRRSMSLTPRFSER